MSCVFQLLCDDVTGLKFNPVLYPRVSFSVSHSICDLHTPGSRVKLGQGFAPFHPSTQVIWINMFLCSGGVTNPSALHCLACLSHIVCFWEEPWPSQGFAWSARHGIHKRLNYGKALTHIFAHFLFSLAQGLATDRQFWWARSEQHFQVWSHLSEVWSGESQSRAVVFIVHTFTEVLSLFFPLGLSLHIRWQRKSCSGTMRRRQSLLNSSVF